MVKISGYQMARVEMLNLILEKHLTQLDRITVANNLEIAVSTAGNYLQLLAGEYPKAMNYNRGILMITNPIPTVDIPIEARMKAKEQQITQLKELTNKILKNHLKHSDKQEIEDVIRQLKKRIDEL